MSLTGDSTLSTPAAAWPTPSTQRGKGRVIPAASLPPCSCTWAVGPHLAQRGAGETELAIRRHVMNSYAHLVKSHTKATTLQAPWDSSGLTQFPAAEMEWSSCPFPGLFCSFQLTALIAGSAGPGRRTASLASCT